MSGDPHFPDQVPLTDQDIADLRQAEDKHGIGGENAPGTPNPFEVTRRVLMSHGFDPSSYYFRPNGTLWGRQRRSRTNRSASAPAARWWVIAAAAALITVGTVTSTVGIALPWMEATDRINDLGLMQHGYFSLSLWSDDALAGSLAAAILALGGVIGLVNLRRRPLLAGSVIVVAAVGVTRIVSANYVYFGQVVARDGWIREVPGWGPLVTSIGILTLAGGGLIALVSGLTAAKTEPRWQVRSSAYSVGWIWQGVLDARRQARAWLGRNDELDDLMPLREVEPRKEG